MEKNWSKKNRVKCFYFNLIEEYNIKLIFILKIKYCLAKIYCSHHTDLIYITIYTLYSQIHNSQTIIDFDKSNIFAKHLSNVFKPYEITLSLTQQRIISNFLYSPLSMVFPAKHINSGGIFNIICTFSIKKASGHDLISNLIVKNFQESLSYFFHTYSIHYFDCHTSHETGNTRSSFSYPNQVNHQIFFCSINQLVFNCLENF